MISKNDIKRVRQLEMKKYRQREGLFVAEGPKVVGDLLRCGFEAEVVYAVRAEGRERTVEVSEEELRKLSFLQHPQGVLGLFRLPSYPSHAVPSTPTADNALYLALDGVQDPGNLGTIIRVADWFGVEAIFCSHDTADAWAPKVVQATMGSIARVPIVYGDLQELLATTTLPVYGTLLDGDDLYQQPLSPTGIIVMGNEGNGISAPIRQLVTKKLLIPSFRQGDTAESLNVAIATAIVCAEFRRKSAAASL